MVMDAQPSPQSVGREFVRQYYTLLNKAPNHLHRFYNNQSSFIHCGVDSQNREATPVIGQKNIHSKIQQLNFRDCHAKISQVDAQATLGSGVVVQVTGELSNDGQPMRRFTQTFVLAAQSPKNYYVHNDIFRYQDVYSDEENEGENRSENDEEHDNEAATTKLVVEANNQQQMGQQPGPQIFYSMPQGGVASARPIAVVTGQNVPIVPFSGATVAVAGQQPQLNGVIHDDILHGMQQTTNQIVVPPANVPNVAAPVIVPQQPQMIPQPTPPPSIPTLPNTVTISAPVTVINQPLTSMSPLDAPKDNKPMIHDLPELDDSPIKQDIDIKDELKMNEQPERVDAMKNQNEPKTYANLFKSISSPGSGFVPLPPVSQQASSGSSMTKPDIRSENIQSGGLPQRTNSRFSKDFQERRTSNVNSQFGDSHQLFLGNVPHHATEEELKALFSRFGTVADLRIHSKPGAKLPGMRNPPNYGFITYEDPESVQNCLNNCPLYFPDNSPDGQKLNVEEKKPRMRNVNDMPRPVNNMPNSGGGMGGNPQRPSGGPNRSLSNSGGGMIRGGSGGNGLVRGSSGGPRSGGFNRNDNRGPGGGPQNRGGNGNTATNAGGGNSYGRR